jgi:hypothetical protein
LTNRATFAAALAAAAMAAWAGAPDRAEAASYSGTASIVIDLPGGPMIFNYGVAPYQATPDKDGGGNHTVADPGVGAQTNSTIPAADGPAGGAWGGGNAFPVGAAEARRTTVQGLSISGSSAKEGFSESSVEATVTIQLQNLTGLQLQIPLRTAVTYTLAADAPGCFACYEEAFAQITVSRRFGGVRLGEDFTKRVEDDDFDPTETIDDIITIAAVGQPIISLEIGVKLEGLAFTNDVPGKVPAPGALGLLVAALAPFALRGAAQRVRRRR